MGRRRNAAPEEYRPRPETAADDSETAILAAELGGAPELDLHGQDPEEARRQLESFVHHAFVEGTEVVKIIHGRGSGKLREVVQRLLQKLKEAEVVAAFRDGEAPAEQGGVTYAVLQPNTRRRGGL